MLQKRACDRKERDGFEAEKISRKGKNCGRSFAVEEKKKENRKENRSRKKEREESSV